MARAEALPALDTINSAKAEGVESIFAQGWEPTGYSHRLAEVFRDLDEAVFQAVDFRVKLGGAWRRLLRACFAVILSPRDSYWQAVSGWAEIGSCFRPLLFIERFGDLAPTKKSFLPKARLFILISSLRRCL